MSKNNLLLGFILGLMATFFLLSAGKAQDGESEQSIGNNGRK